MIHLDTNFLIQALLAGSSAELELQSWIATGEDLSISAIAWSEFLCGPFSAQEESLADVLFPAPEPFLAADARLSAGLFNATGRRSRSLADCQIAAVAIRCGARLATSNLADFIPFQPHGLALAS